MPKSKPSAASVAYNCDICDFKVTNHYIFKRHLHKCYTLHGIASKRSSPRQPLRMKGTEGVRTKGSDNPGSEDLEDDSLSDLSRPNSSQPNVGELVDEIDNENPVLVNLNRDQDGSISPISSQWSVKDSPQIMTDDIAERGDDVATKDISVAKEVEATIDTDTSFFDDRKPQNDSPSLSVVKAKFERQYSCDHCPYQTLKSREHLYHIRDIHGEKLNIFECHLCDYASRYNNKLARHMTVHKKTESMDEEIYKEQKTDLVMDSYESQELKVKPLKLKRLHVKAPSVFQVTHESKLKRESQESPPMGKDVFKMVLTADGSHHYQCRDCLFYANSAHAVKKHHNLCHNKVLQCGHCDFNTTSQAEHYEHMMTHEGSGKQLIKCPDCSYVTSARSNYDNHRSFHGCDLPFKCRVCNFAADSESKVKRHMATQHTNRNAPSDSFLEDMTHQGDAIGTEESFHESMYQDMEGMNPNAIGQCSNTIMEESSNKQKKRLIKYKCPHCLVVCLRRANLTRHLVARHDYTQTDASVCSKNLERQALRKRKMTFSAASLPAAKLKRPASVGQDVLKCSECSYNAKWPSDLRRHKQVHTMVKRFKCPMCTNKYKYLGDLNVHMRRDHLTEPQHAVAENVVSSEVVKKSSPAVFRCPICAYSTQTKADLEQHSKQHGAIEKTFQCRLCDYQTYWRGDVGRHLFRHHSIHLSKDGMELEKHFIFRPEIRPLTKMPMSLYLSMSGGVEGVKMEKSSDKSATPPGLKNTSLNSSGKEGQFICNYPSCDYRTTTADRLESHLAFHENLKQFMCPTCGKRTNWKWDIVKHMVKVHNDPGASADDVVTLSIQEARETISDYLVQFERKSVETFTFRCSICNFKSNDRAVVIQHLDVNHPNEEGHVLSFSSATANKNKDSNAAESGLSSEDKFVEPPPEELANCKYPFACSICEKPEMTLADIKKHYNYAHPYKEIRVIYTVDGTEFNLDTREICHKKSDLPLESEDTVSPNAQQTSPFGAKSMRPDSKFSNPKMHGYVKPFKCSVCGLRSNWKWDLKKHLRAKHPRDGGFVIMLSIQEAQMTYGKECSRSHPKCERQFSEHSPIKTEPDFYESAVPHDSVVTSGKSKTSPALGTQYDPSRRQWKCSGCDYITNWRRNMARHMGRHHPNEKSKLRVIALHLLSKEEQETILEERKERLEKLGKTVDQDEEEEINAENETGDPSTSRSWSGIAGGFSKFTYGMEDRLWSCPKCSFQSTLKTHIIVHMQKHEMKPFLCAVCNAPFMNRGPLHRHLQKVHERADYVKLVKVNIKYDGVDHSQYAMQCFLCSFCDLRFSDRQTAAEHLLKEHGVEDNDDYIITGPASLQPVKSKAFSVGADHRVRNRKLHHCRLCPYQSQKKAMLTFHMTYHKPSPANRFKCKYCPYYVSTTRLLHQHQRKWHSDGRRTDAVTPSWEHQLQMQASPPHTPAKSAPPPNMGTGTPRRHMCEKCPYTTNSKNDFFYHKQFHRPKRTAEFKCEFCDYWVVHKRLLKQHMRLHTDEPINLQDISPAKSVYSDPGLVYDPIELTDLAALKQKMISAKILPSLSKSPKISPMKLASRCAVDDKPGYVLKNGLYRKLHKCPNCPYTNTRARNMQLHVTMHGPRESSYPLMRCPYCDYYVGSKGLLSHHMKVHQKNYGDTPEKDALMASMGLQVDEEGDESDDVAEIQAQQKVDTLLQISRMKRFGCEKCPYASAKRQHFERHLELHGSRQRYTCQHCDYSVPSSYLLTQHSRLHLMPNQNLLSSQSINNLQHLSEVPADVALASALPPSDSDMSVTISVIHDHLGLYENSIYDPEQRKLYRCDRCPYANVRRDHLLSHLKFHMVPSILVCPYCDYSAPKQSLLTQHIRVHFCPLPELSDWLFENGQTERETNQRNSDFTEALKVAQEYQNQSKNKSKGKGDNDAEEKENIEQDGGGVDTLICQYCDREFGSSEKLVKHELQHLIGNQFEMALKVLNEDKARDVKTKECKEKVGTSGAVNVPKDETKITEKTKEESQEGPIQNGKVDEECLSKEKNGVGKEAKDICGKNENEREGVNERNGETPKIDSKENEKGSDMEVVAEEGKEVKSEDKEECKGDLGTERLDDSEGGVVVKENGDGDIVSAAEVSCDVKIKIDLVSDEEEEKEEEEGSSEIQDMEVEKKVNDESSGSEIQTDTKEETGEDLQLTNGTAEKDVNGKEMDKILKVKDDDDDHKEVLMDTNVTKTEGCEEKTGEIS